MSMKNLPSASVTVEPTGSPFSFETVILTSLTGSSSFVSAVPLRSTSVPRTDVPAPDVVPPGDSVADGSVEVGDVVVGVCANAGAARNCSTPNTAPSIAKTATRRFVSDVPPPRAQVARTLEDAVPGCGHVTDEKRKRLRLSVGAVWMRHAEHECLGEMLTDLPRCQVDARDDVPSDQIGLVHQRELRDRLPMSEATEIERDEPRRCVRAGCDRRGAHQRNAHVHVLELAERDDRLRFVLRHEWSPSSINRSSMGATRPVKNGPNSA